MGDKLVSDFAKSQEARDLANEMDGLAAMVGATFIPHVPPMTDINEIRQGLEGTTAGGLAGGVTIADEMVRSARKEMRPFVPPNDDTLKRALAAAMHPLLSRLEAAEKARDEARAALEFYACNIELCDCEPGKEDKDNVCCGYRAARALAKEQTNG